MDIDEKCCACGQMTGLACPDCVGITPLCADCDCPNCSADKPSVAPAKAAQHTPGPWQYEGSLNGKDLTVARVFPDKSKTELAINGGSGYVATVHTWASGFIIKGTEAEANARFIAAAPEMLDALQFAAQLIPIARRYFPKSIKNRDSFTLELTCATIGKAIYNAKGEA